MNIHCRKVDLQHVALVGSSTSSSCCRYSAVLLEPEEIRSEAWALVTLTSQLRHKMKVFLPITVG